MASPTPFNAQAPSLAVSATASASTSQVLPNTGNVIRIVNEGPNIAFVSIGAGTQTATLPSGTANTTSTPILANEDAVFSIPSGAVQSISAICRASGTAALTVQVGEGV